MKIGVISDTHITDLKAGLDFLDSLCAGVFSSVDLILHAGDIEHPELLSSFGTRPIIGVCGNCDKPTPEMPEKRIIEAGGRRIGLIHGWGDPAAVVEHVMSSFIGDNLDVLVFGHSHAPFCQRKGRLLLFNPGSATDRREAPFHTVGILTLGTKLSGQIINLDASTKSDPAFEEVL